jgi:hypothetical protein
MRITLFSFFRLDDHRHHVPWHCMRITLTGNLEAGAATFSFPFEIEAGRNDLCRICQGVALQVHDHRFQGLSFDTNHRCQDRLLHVDRSARGQKSDPPAGTQLSSPLSNQNSVHYFNY